MKRTALVVVLALALVFVCATSAFATTGKFYAGGVDYYKWFRTTGTLPVAGTQWVNDGVSGLGANGTNPGAHANYLATTAKCGMCHSVHRAYATATTGGNKLLPTADATCAGCHTGSTAVTAKIITVTPINPNWGPVWGDDPSTPLVVETDFLTNASGAGGGAGPHNDSAADLYADGYMDAGDPNYPAPSYAHGERYGCMTRRCHSTNPHGANSSQYKIFAAKMLFNDTPAQDQLNFPENVGPWSYGGLDATYDALGATDAAVQRFADANPGIITLSGGDILINGEAPDAAETHALVAGLTCGRPCTGDTGGYDECHAEASYAIVDKGIHEQRNHATGLTAAPRGTPGRTGAYTTDNTGEEALGWGGNDNRNWKTGHVAGSFAAVTTAGSYAPIAGCTSCHDQTDTDNTVAGNFTFPHGQTPTGDTNLFLADGVTMATGARSRIWSGYAADLLGNKIYTAGTAQKAYDGQCLKCHRDGTGSGIGQTF